MPSSERLTFIPVSLVDLPFSVLADAYWYPQGAKLYGKHKASLAVKPGSKVSFEMVRKAWSREETWINHSLVTLLGALPEVVMSRLLADALGGLAVSHARVEKLDSANIQGVTGDPDFILRDDDVCVLGECKVRAHVGNHRYSFDQFRKYMLLGAICGAARAPEVCRRRVVHLLVVPDADPAKFCADYQKWSPQVHDRMLMVPPEAALPSPVGDLTSWREYVRATLLSEEVSSRCDINPAALDPPSSRVIAGPHPDLRHDLDQPPGASASALRSPRTAESGRRHVFTRPPRLPGIVAVA